VPATFLGVWDHVRKIYAATPDAQVRGYDRARFSFNSAAAGGRCPGCEGNGVIAHEMSFLPDVTTVCEACGGSRFEPATRDVRYLGLSIGDALDLTAAEAARAFAAHPKIRAPLETMCDLGVGYLHLGQGSHTLSGGEAQRLKLASELTAGTRHEPTLYVLDEPTTGLHFEDIRKLLGVLQSLVDKGNTVIVIEHNLDVIKTADWVVDMGPEGGSGGGLVVAVGTPEEIALAEESHTGTFLAPMLAWRAAVKPARKRAATPKAVAGKAAPAGKAPAGKASARKAPAAKPAGRAKRATKVDG
jgi:excinuclease ABC subunit A